MLTKDEPSLWVGLSPNMKGVVKQELLNAVKLEQNRSINKKARP